MENKELLDTNRVTAERNSTEELEHTAEEISKQTKTNQNNQTRRQKTGGNAQEMINPENATEVQKQRR